MNRLDRSVVRGASRIGAGVRHAGAVCEIVALGSVYVGLLTLGSLYRGIRGAVRRTLRWVGEKVGEFDDSGRFHFPEFNNGYCYFPDRKGACRICRFRAARYDIKAHRQAGKFDPYPESDSLHVDGHGFPLKADESGELQPVDREEIRRRSKSDESSGDRDIGRRANPVDPQPTSIEVYEPGEVEDDADE